MPQLLRYLLSGVFCAGLEYALFQSAHQLLGLDLVLANTLAYVLALVCSFLISKFFVFNAPQQTSVHFQIIAYGLLIAFNYTLSTWLLVYLVESLHWQTSWSKILSMATVAAWNFFIFKKVVYR